MFEKEYQSALKVPEQNRFIVLIHHLTADGEGEPDLDEQIILKA